MSKLVFFQKEDCNSYQVVKFLKSEGLEPDDYSHDFIGLDDDNLFPNDKDAWLSCGGTYKEGVKWLLLEASIELQEWLEEKIKKSPLFDLKETYNN